MKYPVAHVICMMPGVDVCSCVLRYITVCSIALMQYIHSMCDAVHKEYVAMYDALMQYICIYSYSQHMVTRT